MNFFQLLCTIIIGWLIIITTVILYDGFIDKIAVSEMGVVLGTKVNEDGTPSTRLKARLDKAVELYQQGTIKSILVSGAVGKEGYDEALIMREYLLSKHIPDSVIYTDSHGKNTIATAKNTAKIMHQYHLNHSLVISQYFHIARTRMAFKYCGIQNVYSAHPAYFEWRDLYSIAREIIALHYYFFSHKNCD